MRTAEPPPLSSTDTVAVGFRLIIAEGLDHLEAHQVTAHAGDAEAIHQSRVALRRLRASLRLFRLLLDPVVAGWYNDALRALGRSLGAARDWDVFVLETLPVIVEASPADADALDALVRPAQHERERAHLALHTALAASRIETTLSELRDWSSSQEAFATSKAARRPVADLASVSLDQLARTVRRRGRRLGERSDEERHELRKSLKTLRYSIEMLQPLYEHEQVKHYRRTLNLLQEELGQLNDAIAAAGLAALLPSLPGRAAVERWAEGRRQAALDVLPAVWRRFKAVPPFW